MRPFAIACAAIAAATCPAWTATAVSQDWLREAIAPENRMHDFGTVARAAKTEHRFYIKNTQSSDMHLRSARASCGCTTPIIETEWIKPGETGSILARFNTGTFTGSKAATLTISIDRPFSTEIQLNVKGYIRSDVVLNPGEINFGEVPVGEAKTVEVDLDYAGRNDWQLVAIDSPTELAEINFEEVSRGAGRVQYKIVANLKENAPVGLLQNQFLLRTNDRNLTTVPIRFMADVQSPIQVSPQAFALGTVKPGEPIVQRLVVKSKQPFRVTEIRSEQADIRFDPVETPKTAHLLNLVIAPRAPEADLEDAESAVHAIQGEVLLFTDLFDEPVPLKISFELETQSILERVVQARLP